MAGEPWGAGRRNCMITGMGGLAGALLGLGRG